VEDTGPYQHPVQGWFAKRQVRRSFYKALRIFMKKHPSHDRNAAPRADLVTEWREIQAKTLMGSLDMYPDYEEAPGLKEAVFAKADSLYEGWRNQSKTVSYLNELPERERFVIEEQMRALYVSETYLQSTTLHNLAPALSSAQPGKFQWIRRSRLFKKLPNFFKTPANYGLRATEAIWDVGNHRLGFLNWLARRTPFIATYKDSVNIGIQRTLARAPSMLTTEYGFQRMTNPMDYQTHLYSFLFFPTVFGPEAFVSRLCAHVGVQPLASLGSTVIYSVLAAWATCWGFIPFGLFQDDFNRITAPVFGSPTDNCAQAMAE
jgi:hypothetical protein